MGNKRRRLRWAGFGGAALLYVAPSVIVKPLDIWEPLKAVIWIATLGGSVVLFVWACRQP